MDALNGVTGIVLYLEVFSWFHDVSNLRVDDVISEYVKTEG